MNGTCIGDAEEHPESSEQRHNSSKDTKHLPTGSCGRFVQDIKVLAPKAVPYDRRRFPIHKHSHYAKNRQKINIIYFFRLEISEITDWNRLKPVLINSYDDLHS